MTEQIARGVGPDRIGLAYECFGDADAPPVLLVMGLGNQMLGWNEGFCAELAARGLRAIRFDNRDCGRSTHFSDGRLPDFPAGLAGDFSSAAYRLEDMAADAVGLLDVLGIERTHVVGASMGGQIAQIIATDFPARVRSLTSMMSWTGSRTTGQMSPESLRLFAMPPAMTREQAMENMVTTLRLIGSPAFPQDEAMVRERAGQAFDRGGYDPGAMPRQGMAALASGDRTTRLASVRAPTLVIHGTQDRMVDASGGRATAAAIPGAALVMIEGMGHNLPRELWPRLADLIAAHAHRADAAAPAV
jgi:pimeloyl-ACP methyl ester carboxylesterase